MTPEVRTQLDGADASTYAAIGDLLDTGVMLLDRDMVVMEWNRWLERATRKRRDEVIGRRITEVESNLRPAARAAIERSLGGATVVMSHALHGYLVSAPPPTGFERFERMRQSVRLVPLYRDGYTCGVVAFVDDVTERVAREEDLRAAVEQAQKANRAKSDFLASMSHELRTPIGAISGYTDLLADGLFGAVSEMQREQLIRVKGVAAHLLRIVEEILGFARLEAGREQAHISDVDIGTLVHNAVVAVEPLARKKGLSLRYEAPTEPIVMRTDEVKARQILINLLGNAVKFTDDGHIAVEVSVSAAADMITIAVTDTGSGIPEAECAEIFEPFNQGRSSLLRKSEGTGLGLSVSRQLARFLGGDLTVSSVLGVGSTFRLTLPL